MTAIAAVTDGTTVWMGADSAGSSGDSIYIRRGAKVFTTGPYVIGFTTSFRMGQLLRYGFAPPVPQDGADLHEHMCTSFTDALRKRFADGGWGTRHDGQEAGGQFLVGVHGRLFEVWSDYDVAEYEEPYAATGCGKDLVLGSLHTTAQLRWEPERRLSVALEAAARFCSRVAPPMRIVRVPEDVPMVKHGARRARRAGESAAPRFLRQSG